MPDTEMDMPDRVFIRTTGGGFVAVWMSLDTVLVGAMEDFSGVPEGDHCGLVLPGDPVHYRFNVMAARRAKRKPHRFCITEYSKSCVFAASGVPIDRHARGEVVRQVEFELNTWVEQNADKIKAITAHLLAKEEGELRGELIKLASQQGRVRRRLDMVQCLLAEIEAEQEPKEGMPEECPSLVDLGFNLHTALRKCCDSAPTSIAWSLVALDLGTPIWRGYLEAIRGHWEEFRKAKTKYDFVQAFKAHSLYCFDSVEDLPTSLSQDQRRVAVLWRCAFGSFSDEDWKGFAWPLWRDPPADNPT